MQELKPQYIKKPWAGDASRYSVDDLLKAIPRSMARYARRVAESKGVSDLSKSDLFLFYREKNGDVNVNGIAAALESIDQIKGPSPAEIASARAELMDHSAKARKALGLDRKDKSTAEEFGETGLSMIQDLVESAAWANVPVERELGSERIPEHVRVPEPAFAQPAIARGMPAGQSFGSDSGYQTAVLDGGVQTFDAPTPNPGMFAPYNPAFAGGPGGQGFGERALAAAPTPVSLATVEFAELATSPVKLTNAAGIAGVVDNDYRPLPNWKALGMGRPAGDATPEELNDLQGATRADGAALQPNDVLSVPAMICNVDLIAQFASFIPPLELGRLGVIAATRAIKSDQDHSRQVMSGNFTIAPSSVKIGTDPDSTLHVDHPLLGKVPYTALIGRLLFQKIAEDEDQMAAIAAVMANKVQNLSIAFGFGSVTCALCGEVPIQRVLRDNGQILGFTINPQMHSQLCSMQPDDFSSYDPVTGTLRTPADTPGGYGYRTVRVTACTPEGTVTIEPIPEAGFDLARGTVFMFDMCSGWFFGGRYCRFHGRAGSYYSDGRKNAGAFTNTRSFVNLAACDKGAVEARIVLVP